jgi:diguanylate cyclase (GGDEF)-like protein/PAS domain S-box-containing protein
MSQLSDIFDAEEPVQVISDVVPAGLLIIRVEDGQVIFSNRCFEELLGEGGSAVFGDSWEKFFVDPEDRQKLMMAFVSDEEVRNRELKLRRNDGEIIWGMVSISSITIGEEDMLLFAINDVTPLKRAIREIEHMANHDALTGLPSLRLLDDRLSHTISQARRQKDKVAIMFVDLDNFKSVNDTLGHDIGDIVLQEAAVRMKSCVRESDTVARIGGDEFIIVLETHHPERTLDIANRVIRKISTPLDTQAGTTQIGASIGISIFPDNGDGPDDLIKAADEAMYRIKKDTKGGVTFA